jgi:hypothetical protein
MPVALVSWPSCRKPGSGSRAWCRPSWPRRVSPFTAPRSLRDYVEAGIISGEHAELLRAAVRERKNILVAGGGIIGPPPFMRVYEKQIDNGFETCLNPARSLRRLGGCVVEDGFEISESRLGVTKLLR